MMTTTSLPPSRSPSTEAPRIPRRGWRPEISWPIPGTFELIAGNTIFNAAVPVVQAPRPTISRPISGSFVHLTGNTNVNAATPIVQAPKPTISNPSHNISLDTSNNNDGDMATHPSQGQEAVNRINTKRTMPSVPGLPSFWSDNMNRAIAHMQGESIDYEKMVPRLKAWFPQLTNEVITGPSLEKQCLMLELMHNDYFKEASFERVKRLKAAGIPVDEYDESKYPIEAPKMKSDLELFGDDSPMTGALALGATTEDYDNDPYAPKFGKMSVNDKKLNDKKGKLQPDPAVKAESDERKACMFGTKMTPLSVKRALRRYKSGDFGEGGRGPRKETGVPIQVPGTEDMEGDIRAEFNAMNTHHVPEGDPSYPISNQHSGKDTIKPSRSTNSYPLADMSNNRFSPPRTLPASPGMEAALERRRLRDEERRRLRDEERRQGGNFHGK
ncbi:hypothetical protein N7G274_005408 [Stereocaulon virgatum]|uniref:Uncharacterized protein n=1 Tax=Stereocaulon virgatum TaxID=373712 RepID=A0ABR4A6T3_9LECA